jgi:hypothetical protein
MRSHVGIVGNIILINGIVKIDESRQSAMFADHVAFVGMKGSSFSELE